MIRHLTAILVALAVLNPFCCCTAGGSRDPAERSADRVAPTCGCTLAVTVSSETDANRLPLPEPSDPCCRHCSARLAKQVAQDPAAAPDVVGAPVSKGLPDGEPSVAGPVLPGFRMPTPLPWNRPPNAAPWTPRVKCALLI